MSSDDITLDLTCPICIELPTQEISFTNKNTGRTVWCQLTAQLGKMFCFLCFL